jgi:hypothetical protein
MYGHWIKLPKDSLDKLSGIPGAGADEPPADEPGHDCTLQGHAWDNFGTRKAWCKHCPAEGEWDMGVVRRIRMRTPAPLSMSEGEKRATIEHIDRLDELATRIFGGKP